MFLYFVQNILNNMEESCSGRAVVESALASMTNVAQHINEMKRKHEHAVRIQEIQSLLSEWEGEDLTTYGDLVLEVGTEIVKLTLLYTANFASMFIFSKI